MTGRIGKPLFLFALALPALLMLGDSLFGTASVHDLLHPSGELSIRLVVAAMLPGPLAAWFGPTRFLRGWLAIRRNLGVAAFAYALLHLVFYLADKGQLAEIMGELALPAIWTGWLAFLLMAAPAVISNNTSMRALGRKTWKGIQRLTYPVLFLSLAHWILLDWHWKPALVHFVPVLGAWLFWAAAKSRKAAAAKPV